MSKHIKQPENGDNEQTEEQSSGKARLYISIVAIVLGAISFGLSFTKLGVYSLIASVLFEIAAVSFANAQKMKNYSPAVKYVRICAYAALTIVVLFFAGGIIYSAT